MEKNDIQSLASTIFSKYVKDDSKKGVLAIFDYVRTTGPGMDFEGILKEHKREPFLNDTQLKLIVRLHNEYRSLFMIRRALNMIGGLEGFFVGKRPVELCGEIYLEGDDLQRYNNVKDRYFRIKEENEEAIETVKSIFKVYSKSRDFEETANELEIGYEEYYLLMRRLERIKLASSDKFKLLCIGRYVCNKDKRNVRDVIELLESNSPIDILEDLTKTPYYLREDIEFLKNEKFLLASEYEKLKQFCTEYHRIYYANRGAEKYEALITDFIENGNPNVEEYCNAHDIKIGSFKISLTRLRIISSPVAIQYDEFMKANEPVIEEENNNSKKSYAILIGNCERIAHKIRMGVLENESIRKFDIIDYHKMTKVDINEILRFAIGKVSEKDFRTLEKFVNSQEYDNRLNLEAELKTEYVVGIKADEKGKPIPGTGRIITNEEKIAIVEYLKYNYIPVTVNSYNAAIDRLANGFLDLSQTLEHTKTK